ncbi:MAG: zinc ribbon domain-containing protein [Nitrospirota bacterium]|nr:zinc ribbon domain-containing protein [Nitrospirota bacterium]
MPIYEYQCAACGKCFEKLVFGSNPVVECPFCGSKETQKRLSKFGLGKGSGDPSSGSSSGCSGCSSSSCAGCK